MTDGYLPYAEAVPQGKAYYGWNKNVDPSLAGVGADAREAVSVMRTNSPTFAKAYDARLGESRGVAIVPVMGGGGTVNGNGNVVFGVMAGVRPDGSVVYPAYTITHEFGHTFQKYDRNNAAWNVSPEWGSPERLAKKGSGLGVWGYSGTDSRVVTLDRLVDRDAPVSR